MGPGLLVLLAALVLSPAFAGLATAQAPPAPDLPKLFDVPELDGELFKTVDRIALEEHRFFTYIVAKAAGPKDGDGQAGQSGPELFRRFVLLKPSTYVIDDVVRGKKEAVRYLLRSDSEARRSGKCIETVTGDRRITCENLFPAAAPYRQVVPASESRSGQAEYELVVSRQGSQEPLRAIHLLSAGPAANETPKDSAEIVCNNGVVRLTVRTLDRVFRLILPPPDAGAGEIAVSGSDGHRLLARRLFPSGVLPSGPEGTRLLERWDARYRQGSPPPWDTGRPSSDLKRAVQGGTIRPCRAVVLGCGPGTNAIYLAGQGFDVTAIDIAPTALSQCRKKAEEAGVEVQWLLADVLAPPELEPFDFIYDRGCYHGVRRQNAAGYVDSVRKLSRPGTRILIMAGNANEEGRYGPPRVKEEELRGDFSELFEFERLEETRFDTKTGEGQGALGWSVLLKRKPE
jgi:SAM-dependent methyltransferase